MQIDTCGRSHLAVTHPTEEQTAFLPIWGQRAWWEGWQGWEGRVIILDRRHEGTQIFQMRKRVHFRTKARVDATYLEGRTF